MEAQIESEEAPVENDISGKDDYYPDDAPMDFGGNASLSDIGGDEMTVDDTGAEEAESEEDNLPSPADLDVGDMSDSSNPELEG